MTRLAKAYLAEISADKTPHEVDGTKVYVQFNPTSLRVQISNRTAGGQQAGAQARQRPGTGEMQVGFDLVFDTADEGRTGAGVSVLARTKAVERFVRPRSAQPGQEAPPRVVFVWGQFHVQGVMESANIDLDLFDADGVPLRAKVAVSIKGQDPDWAYKPDTSAFPANTDGRSPTDPQRGNTKQPPGAPGTQGNGLAPDRIVQAMPGESLAQMAARSGFDPAAWRALADGQGNPLQLQLGQEVALPPAAALGLAAGSAGQGLEPARTAAGLPLVDSAQASALGEGSNASSNTVGKRAAQADTVLQGHAVTSQGGLQGAIAQVKGAAHQQGAGNSLAAFGLPAGATAEASDRPWGMGVPLRPRFGSGRPAPAMPSLASVTPLAGRQRGRWSSTCGGGCGCSRCKH